MNVSLFIIAFILLLTVVAENAKAEIGFDIARAFWGRGCASEAVCSLLNKFIDINIFSKLKTD
ncbi:GNAT family N-acetyltransferase [Paenibacillus sp. DMB20]|uniref:GNAT family N-acetyltransferase n=1 Tax=Paenibacillus sp. DMB20 TaxID=1642570 RepID=UPI003FA573FB